jgi:MFS transporter, PPP family, 3-phenylpropionic acid transporter
MQPRSPHTLSVFYFTAFALLGAYLPYFTLYAESLGFTGLQIGILAAAIPLGKVVFGPLWSYASDRAGSRKGIAVLSVSAATLAFSLTLVTERFLPLVGILYLYAAVLAPVVPLVEATTLEMADKRGWQYGRIRVWGSLGFIVTALLLGWLLDVVPIRHVLHAILVISLANLIATLRIPPSQSRPAPPRVRLLPAVLRPMVVVFFLSTLLMQASHGSYYAFFSIFMERAGYSREMVGVLWSLGVLAEMATMVGAAWLLRHVGVARLLTGCLLLAALRWTLYSFTTWLPLLLLGQMLHAFTFGAFHVAAVTGTYRLFPEGLRASGQSLYSGLTFGLGSIVGFLSAGRLFEVTGSIRMFLASASMALAAALLSITLWRHERLRPPAGGA